MRWRLIAIRLLPLSEIVGINQAAGKVALPQ